MLAEQITWSPTLDGAATLLLVPKVLRSMQNPLLCVLFFHIALGRGPYQALEDKSLPPSSHRPLNFP